jgi:hypothetical protein
MAMRVMPKDRLHHEVEMTPPWYDPDLFPTAQPLSPFWQLIYYSGMFVGSGLFIYWLSEKVMPEAMEWVHTIRPYLRRSYAETVEFLRKRKEKRV